MAGPKAPDPNATARAQEGANVRTATTQSRLNMVDQTTPTGTLNYKQTGTWEDGTPKFEAVTNLSAPQQGLQRQQEEFGGLVNQLGIDQTKRLSNHLSAPVSFDGAPSQVTNISDDFSADRGRVEEALMSRINPQLDRDRQSLDTRLVASGLRPGSDAWSRAMETQGQTANDARMQAILGAGNEQQRLFQMSLQNAGLNNQGRQQSIQETLALRNQPLQEIGALMSGGQVSMPTFQNTPQTGVANTDVASLINNNYAQQVGQHNAMLGGLSNLGSAFILSDRRAKTDIKKVGRLDNGLPIYRYKYRPEFGGGGLHHLGVMAQDVEKQNPSAVGDAGGGFMAVDYELATEAA